jgi:hypothetical protein
MSSVAHEVSLAEAGFQSSFSKSRICFYRNSGKTFSLIGEVPHDIAYAFHLLIAKCWVHW